MPDWTPSILNKLVSIRTGKLNSNAAKPDGKYPFFTCSRETFRTDTFSFDTECVLLAGNNANGVFPIKFFSGKFDAYQRTYVIETLDKNKILNRFLYYALELQLEHMQSLSTGAATKFLTLTILNNLQVFLPPIEVQRKITAVLSAYDDLIENNTRRIAILEEMAQALYREWFVHFRFPGHEDVPLVEVDGMQIPEGWQVVKLQAIAEVNARNIGKTNSPAIINYIDISSVSTGIINQTALIPFSEAPSRARRLVENGDIIWSTVRPNRKSYALIIEPRPNTVVSTGFAVISATQIPYSYLYHAVTAEKFVDYLTNHAKGAAYPAVSQDDFMNAEILLAPTELLKQFNHVVQDMVILKHTLLTKNANLRQTRDLLLPRLISGELDVSHIPRRDVALQRLYHPNTP